MEFERERIMVIEAGKRLVANGLIARTWGNVSCRVDAGRFAVTPSGRSYDTLKPEDIVLVGIVDLSYTGGMKPSSEKAVHAEVYRQRPNVSFVIHTHQPNASVAAALGRGVTVPEGEARRLIGGDVELAAYGLPGTKKLRRGVGEALKRTQSRAVLMAHHGALCFGADEDRAFAAALALEDACAGFAAAGAGDPPAGPLPEAELMDAVRRARPELGVVRVSALPAVVTASRRPGVLRPYLDDFAQLIGISVRAVAWDSRDEGKSAREAARALKGRNAVLIAGYGALCAAGNASDAEAVETVLQKGCLAALAADAAGGGRPIAPPECALMRFVYLRKYSKMAK